MVEVSALQTIFRSHQKLEEQEGEEIVKAEEEEDEEEESRVLESRDTDAEIISVALGSSCLSSVTKDTKTNATTNVTETSIPTSESIELKQNQSDDATKSADQRLYFKQQQQHLQAIKTADELSEKFSYQLRALRNDISALESNPWLHAPTLPQVIQTSTLSSELVNETLNYFVNCGQRLSQMTKTYDDNDAYILLLQEKEVDLELAARIGQDLLKQNNQLKDSVKNLESELAKSQNDLQQLRHELASKVSLLDTFIEEEEHQNSLAESLNEPISRHQESANSTNVNKQTVLNHVRHPQTPTDCTDDDCSNGFSSLNCNHQIQSSRTPTEPFTSLPHHFTNSSRIEANNLQLKRDDSANSICDHLNASSVEPAPSSQQQKLVQTVTIQLVESNKRLCELQEELMHRGEQNLLQQERIHQLQRHLGDTDRRLGDVALENENLQKTIVDSARIQKELSEELKICRRNFDELLSVFLELQKETRAHRMRDMQENSNVTYFDNNNTNSTLNNSDNNNINNNNDMFISSLLNELQESMKSDGENSDGADSGVPGSNPSSSVSPIASALSKDLDSEVLIREERWVGFPSFMLTTILLLCLSVTLTKRRCCSICMLD